jgi:hypothetical protein
MKYATVDQSIHDEQLVMIEFLQDYNWDLFVESGRTDGWTDLDCVVLTKIQALFILHFLHFNIYPPSALNRCLPRNSKNAGIYTSYENTI